jgi:tetratricopeptide (TPR) repeat protein
LCCRSTRHFDEAQAAEDAGDIAEAERLYRVLMKCDPTDAAPPFNLGNMFRATGRKIEAEAALRAATRADPTFAEGWYNLSDLLDEQGRSEAAIDCLRHALRAAPDYAERCSILRCCYSEAIGTRKRQSKLCAGERFGTTSIIFTTPQTACRAPCAVTVSAP